jgi:large subunit ribosomal protein L15
MKPHEVRSPAGAHTKRTRKGRGEAAGKGKTAGRGTKGTRARNTVHAFFEGGQMPLIRRVPKLKGFTPPRRKVYGAVNLTQLGALEGSDIGPDQLRAAGFVRKRDALIKILGDGEISRAVTVSAHAFSATAKTKIEGAGGTATVIQQERPERKAK